MGIGAIIAWIIIGIIAGWIAEKIMGRNDSLLMNLIIGVVGAIVGGWIIGAIFGTNAAAGGWIWRILVSVIGAVILLAIVNMIRGRPAR